MKYTEEEKEVIEILNTFKYRNKTKNYKELTTEDCKSAEILLNIIENQQKEIEELKEHKKNYTNKRKNYIKLYKLLEKHLDKEKQNVAEKNKKIQHLENVLSDKNKLLKNSISKETIREKMLTLYNSLFYFYI